MSQCILPFSLLLISSSLAAPCWGQAPVYHGPALTQVQMKQAMRLLKQAASVDPDAKRYQSSVQAIVRRCAGEAAVSPTPSETSLARSLVTGNGDPGHTAYKFRGLLPLAQFNAALRRMPGIATRPTFVAGARKTPLGRTVGYVRMEIERHSNTLVDVPSTKEGFDVGLRAEAIRSRLAVVASRDPLWWTRLDVALIHGQVVVASPSAPNGYLITADQRFAQVRNTTPQQLAMDLIQEIRSTFDAPPKGMKFRSLRDPNASRREAVQQRAAGDMAFDRGDLEEAERNYSAAVNDDPGCLLAYAGLGEIYAQKKDIERSRHNYEKALQCPGIQERDRIDIQNRLDRLDKIAHE